ncbi:MAG: fibronectin type III domain-containing protein [Candidatus Eisenbacteria bacterium]
MRTGCLLIVLLMVLGFSAFAQSPPTGLSAFDTPSDEGQSITLKWEGEEDRLIKVMRSTSQDGDYAAAGEALASDGSFTDGGLTEGTDYYYRLAYPSGTDTIYTAVAGPATPKSNWFRKHRTNTLVLTVLMFVALLSYIHIAKSGKELYIRRIAGLSALDESVGRATEMGKKIFYIPGILSISEIQTIASLSILGHVAKQTAIYGAQIEVPNIDPLTFSAARETVKQAYAEAGKPDQYSDDMVTYITYDQFAYAAAVSGKMVREKPAANFLIGSFFAESLILAETGNSIGAIQIAGTADLAQLPFFVTACDYTLLGEELYAASAYLSREPVLLGSIKAQDMVKAVIMATIAIGIVLSAFGSDIIRTLLLSH